MENVKGDARSLNYSSSYCNSSRAGLGFRDKELGCVRHARARVAV